MPIQWCSHPVAHSGTTKIGCKPNHPKADRRLNKKLAMFMKESYGISNDDNEYLQDMFLCRTCFDKEFANFSASRNRHTNVKANDDGKMDIENQNSGRLSKVKATSKGFFDTDCSSDECLESPDSQSSEDTESNYLIKYKYQREQAMQILNKVFEVLDIPHIIDM